VRRDHHRHIVRLGALDEHPVDKGGGLRIERPGRLIRKEQERVLCKLSGEYHPLLLAAGEIAGDVHHPVGEPDLIDEVSGPADRFLRRVADIVKRPQDVLDHPIVAIECKRPLEHDGGSAHDPPLHLGVLLRPEVDIERF